MIIFGKFNIIKYTNMYLQNYKFWLNLYGKKWVITNVINTPLLGMIHRIYHNGFNVAKQKMLPSEFNLVCELLHKGENYAK